MTYGSTGSSANSRREEAREKARAIREQHKKLEKRNQRMIRGIIFFGSVAVVGIVAIVIASTIRTPSSGPLNMRSDGIVIGADYVAVGTDAIAPGKTPIATTHDETSEVIAITLYIDYFSPLGSSFQEANGDQLASWVKTGAATLEVHPLAILDRVSQGSRYSSRSANAAACMANFAPDQYYVFHELLLAQQPKENSTGLSDEQLFALTAKAKATHRDLIKPCIEKQSFQTWVAEAKERALTGPIPNSDVSSISSTPTIIVNGLKYEGAPNDSVAFSAFVVQAAGTAFNENSTSTPTPTPTPSPTPTK